MREFYKTENEALERVKAIDAIMNFPDEKSNTLTYAVPQFDEEPQEWWIEVGSDYLEKEVKDETV